MKKIGICLTLTVTILSIAVVFGSLLMASQEPAKETTSQSVAPAQTPGAGQNTTEVAGEPSHQKTRVPVDSSLVIPKGPQWLGAPIMPNGTKLKEESGQLYTEYNLPYKEVLAWYQEALKNYPDARYRDWKEEMYIEDQGGSKWHAIKISKTDGPKTIVTVRKDNWTWILATLVIRFTGVFIVLLILWIGLNISAAIMKRFIQSEQKRQPAHA
jgi:hypothetical protein